MRVTRPRPPRTDRISYSASATSLRYGLIAAFALSACAGQAPVPIPGAESVTAEAPTYKVGDEWRFRGGRFAPHVRVIAVEGDHVVTEFVGDSSCPGCRYYRDGNLTVVRASLPDGKPTMDPTAAIGLVRLSFPLQVGKTWAQELEPYRVGPTQSGRFRIRYNVEAFETVTTKAGTFKAFRVSRTDENLSQNLASVTQLYWYAPDVRWYVKFAPYRGSGLVDQELESYTLR